VAYRLSVKQQFFPHARKKGVNDNYPTPQKLYDELNAEFHFDFDPCPINPHAGMRMRDGLGSWGKSNFVNPPYSLKNVWVKKAIEEQKKGKLSVLLLPVDTSTNLFHDYVLPNAEIRWVRKRLHFDDKGPAKFASMICIFRPTNDAKTIKENPKCYPMK
jgi:site-specific DNA-methyltransferase (adenine-specific)